MFLRSDLLFADDDPLQWPQAFLPDVPHLACIPKKPEAETPDSIMWMTPHYRDFEVEDHGIIRGIGKLRYSWFSVLQFCTSRLCLRATEPIFAGVSGISTGMTSILDDLLHRLQHISTNFRVVQLGVRAVQRAYLELLACLDFVELFKPLMHRGSASIPALSNRIGTITTDINVCNQMYRAGLPVWLIRPWNALHSIRMVNTVAVQYPAGIVAVDPAIRPSYPAIFTRGSPGDKYRSLVDHILGYLTYPDPFNTTRALASVQPPAPLPGPSRKEQRAQRYTPCNYPCLASGVTVNHFY